MHPHAGPQVLEALHALLSTLGDGQVLELVDHDSAELWGLVEAVFCCDFEVGGRAGGGRVGWVHARGMCCCTRGVHVYVCVSVFVCGWVGGRGWSGLLELQQLN